MLNPQISRRDFLKLARAGSLAFALSELRLDRPLAESSRSHGCINLTPQAAKWLYRWTIPTVAPDKELAYGYVGTRVEIKV